MMYLSKRNIEKAILIIMVLLLGGLALTLSQLFPLYSASDTLGDAGIMIMLVGVIIAIWIF